MPHSLNPILSDTESRIQEEISYQKELLGSYGLNKIFNFAWDVEAAQRVHSRCISHSAQIPVSICNVHADSMEETCGAKARAAFRKPCCRWGCDVTNKNTMKPCIS